MFRNSHKEYIEYTQNLITVYNNEPENTKKENTLIKQVTLWLIYKFVKVLYLASPSTLVNIYMHPSVI